MVKGRGARDRSGGNSGGATASSGGDRRASGGDRGGAAARSGNERPGDNGGRVAVRTVDRDRSSETARAEARGDNHADDNREDNQRYAVPRRPHVNNSPAVIVHRRPAVVHVNDAPYYRPRYYAPAYYHHWAQSYYRWSPIAYAPWPLIYGSLGFSNFGFYTAFGTSYPYAPYAAYAPYAPYSPWQIAGSDIGGVRLKIRPRDAQVFVDGYYAGLVDDFDGTFQSLRLEQGGHKIEIHMPGYEDLELDVHVQPGRTLTLQEQMRPRP
jgi:hypothetical protein